jgi:hypothetical protein
MHEIQLDCNDFKIVTKRAKLEESVIKSNMLTTDCDDDKVRNKEVLSLSVASKREIKINEKINLRSEAKRTAKKSINSNDNMLSDTE